MPKEVRIGDNVFYNEFAEVAASVSDEEWAFYDFLDEVSDQIHELMEKEDLTKAELAKKMGTTRAFITKVLRGDNNMTFKTFTKLVHNLGARAEVKIARKQDGIKWMGLVDVKTQRAKASSELRAVKFDQPIDAVKESECVEKQKDFRVA